MNWRGIFALMRKDLKLVTQSRTVMMPIIIVPIIFLIGLPVGALVLLTNDAALEDLNEESAVFLDHLPASIQEELEPYTTDAQKWTYLLVIYQFAPLFLIVPLMVSSVIGADSFAGERERKTIEALIYTPMTDTELYIAKMLAAWIPAILIALLGGILYALILNGLMSSRMGGIFFPNLMWIVLLIWLAPAVAGLGLGAMVLVSSRVKGFQEAYQLGGMVVLPVILLFISQLAGVLYFNMTTVLMIGLVIWLIVIALLYYGAKTFQRGELLAKL